MSKGFSQLSRVAASLFAIATLSAPASAQTGWFAEMTSAQEVGPPNGSLGTGYAFVSLTGNLLSISIQFSGLTGNTVAAHIHCCAPPGVNAMVATQTPSFAGFPLGVTNGFYSNTYDLTLASSWNPAFITASGGTVSGAYAVFLSGLTAGNAYVNIHTSTAPGGEIRGQLVVAPEPSTVALLTAGLAAMVFVARRRRS